MAQIPSQNCTFCSKIAALYCYDCQQCLCTQCQKNIHGIVAVCRDHKVGDIHKAGNRIYKPVPTCVTHNKEFICYCGKCDCLTCKECITNSHNGHMTKEIKNIADIRRKDLNQKIDKLKTKVEEMEETLKMIDGSHSLQIQSDCDSYIENVEKTYQEMYQIIDRNKLIYVTTATDFRENEKHDLKRKRVFYQRLINEYSDRLLKFKNLLLEPHDSTFFTEWKGLQTEFQSMTEETEQSLLCPIRLERFNQDTFRRAVIKEFDSQFEMGLKEQEMALTKMTEEFGELRSEVESKQRIINKVTKEAADNIKTITTEFEGKIKLLEAKLTTSEEDNYKAIDQCNREREENTRLQNIILKQVQDLEATKRNNKDMQPNVHQKENVSASSGHRNERTFKTSEGIIVKVLNGNILNLDVDCIVNAANENLNHGEGDAYVIAAAAGYDFEKESDDYIQQNGPINEGSCCTTSAGKLKYKSVIHTVGPKWHTYNDKRECCRILKKSVECCFFEAEVNGMSSVAIPSISAGIFGVPKEVCCKEYSKAVEDFSRKNGNTTCLKEIHFIDKDAGMTSMIQKEFSQIFNQISSSNTGSSSGFSPGGQGRITQSMSSPDDPEVTKGKTQIRKDNFAGSVSKFQKQFLFKKDLKVVVVQEDIINMNVGTIVCPQDENISNKCAIARAIANVCDYSYDQSVKALKWILKSETKNVKASPASVPFKYVLHTVPPRYDKYAEASRVGFDLDLERTIRNILRHCNLKEVTSVAMPVLGIGKDGLGTPVSVFAKIFLVVLQEEIKYGHKFNIKEINIVTNDIAAASTIADEFRKEKVFTEVTSFGRSRNKGDKGYKKPDTTQDTKMAMAGKTFKGKLTDGDENCIICTEPNTRPHQLTCGHVFCKNCVQEFLKVKPVCPTCGSIQGVIKGDQPAGTMNRREVRYSLSGFMGYSTIEIEYEIYSGKQGEQHPNPGKYFKGIKRTAYLPNTKKGKLIADLLKIAFDRRLVFTIGHSRTTGEEGVVTWNDIHHKTSMTKGHQFGYPDEGYFDRVLDELKIKGVTEEDL